MKFRTRYKYREERRERYPEVSEQLDAIFKGFLAMRNAGVVFPPETVAWMDAVGRVKSELPKELVKNQ